MNTLVWKYRLEDLRCEAWYAEKYW